LICLAATLAPAFSAYAGQWSIESSVSSSLNSNDNINLAPQSTGTVNSLNLSGSLSASRKVEDMSTVLGLSTTRVAQWGDSNSSNGGGDRFDGNASLSQSVTIERNTFSVNVGYSQDFNNNVQTADVAVAPGQRRSSTLGASWSHSLTERLSTSLTVSSQRSWYSQAAPGTVNFTNGSWGGGLNYLLTEIDTLSLNLSTSEYRPDTGGDPSTTEQWTIGISRQWSEQWSSQLSAGKYRTSRSLQPTSSGLQYSTSHSFAFDESTSLSFSSSRGEQPSGSGEVLLNESVSLAANYGFTETLSGALSYNLSNSSGQSGVGAGGVFQGDSKQRSYSASLSKQLTPDVSLGLSYLLTQADNVGASNSAQSNSVSISLTYNFPTVTASR
jgi:hypothetical protein